MTTVQALWFRADDTPATVEPDFLAFTPMDVLNGGGRYLGPLFAVPRLAEGRPKVKTCGDPQTLGQFRYDHRARDGAGDPAPSAGRDGVPPVRRPLRQGRLPGRVPRARLSVRLLVRGLGPHVRGLHAEGLRRRDRPRPAPRGRGAASPGSARSAPSGARCRCAAQRSSGRTSRAATSGLRQPGVRRAARRPADVPRLRADQATPTRQRTPSSASSRRRRRSALREPQEHDEQDERAPSASTYTAPTPTSGTRRRGRGRPVGDVCGATAALRVVDPELDRREPALRHGRGAGALQLARPSRVSDAIRRVRPRRRLLRVARADAAASRSIRVSVTRTCAWRSSTRRRRRRSCRARKAARRLLRPSRGIRSAERPRSPPPSRVDVHDEGAAAERARRSASARRVADETSAGVRTRSSSDAW